jgi:F-type H+-transporting ATPase subunit b
MDLTTTSLEERLVDVFTRRLREMDGRAKEALGEALKAASVPGLVRSAFDLPGEQRAVIQKALNETFSADIHVRFETAPNLIGGIELTTNGQKVAWSIADYLGSLEKSVGELLQEREKAASKAEPKPDAKVAPQPEANVDAHAEAKGESAPEAKAAPQPEAKAALNPAVNVPLKPDAKADSVPETKAAPKPEAKVDAQAEAKGESTPEATIGLIPGAKTEPKSEAKTEPVPGAKAGTNPEAPKPEAKG